MLNLKDINEKDTDKIRSVNCTRRENWCRGTFHLTENYDWKTLIFSDETQVVTDQNKRGEENRTKDDNLNVLASVETGSTRLYFGTV